MLMYGVQSFLNGDHLSIIVGAISPTGSWQKNGFFYIWYFYDRSITSLCRHVLHYPHHLRWFLGLWILELVVTLFCQLCVTTKTVCWVFWALGVMLGGKWYLLFPFLLGIYVSQPKVLMSSGRSFSSSCLLVHSFLPYICMDFLAAIGEIVQAVDLFLHSLQGVQHSHQFHRCLLGLSSSHCTQTTVPWFWRQSSCDTKNYQLTLCF